MHPLPQWHHCPSDVALSATQRCLLLTLLLCTTLAHAQEDSELDWLFEEEPKASSAPPQEDAKPVVLEPESIPQTPARKAPITLEEIVVTAQKRKQSLADVPISVTALGGEKLADAGIENLTDLSEYAPNFKLVDGGLIPNVYMRGVGSGSNQGFELSVGIFADGIHLGRPHQSRAAFMDVERVEVLRGPQSILFGKNAIAGALNIISARPGEEFESQLSAALSHPGEDTELSGFVSGPLTDTLGARLAVRHRGEDGYLRNPMQGRNEPGVNELSSRLTLDWQATELIDTSLKLEHSRRVQAGRTFQTTHPGSLTRCTGEDVQLDRGKVTDARERASIDAYSATLNAEAPLYGGTLSVVSGYTGFASRDLFDADSSSLDTLALLGVEDYDQFSQEIRFTSPLGSFVDFIAGAFYQQGALDFYEFGPTRARAGALSESNVCELNLQVIAEADLERDFSIDGAAWSLFAQTTINFNPRFRTTLGLRYVHENKDGYRRFSIFEPGTRDPANPATMAALDQLLINEHELARSRTVGSLLPSVNLQYDFGDDLMAYFSYTKGAKSGSYDARNNNGNTDASGGATRFEFDDETADALELGSKLRLAGGAASLNLALFHVDYQDMQVSVYDGVAGFTVTNAASARTQGLEIDGRWLLSEALMLNAALALLDFSWLDYRDGPCYAGAPNEDPDTGTCDLSGRENQQTPRWTASLSATWFSRLTPDLLLSATLDSNFRDRHFTSGDLDPRGLQAAHTKFNSRLSVGPDDDRWAIALVGKNLSDELTVGIGAPTSLDIGGYRVATERTRTIALEGRFRF